MTPPHSAPTIGRSRQSRPSTTAEQWVRGGPPTRWACGVPSLRQAVADQLLEEREHLLLHAVREQCPHRVVHSAALSPPDQESLQRGPQRLRLGGLPKQERLEGLDDCES